jgi:oligopeptide transport system substrate-binding protein
MEYTVCRAGWLGDYPDPMTFLSIWRTGDGNNCTGFANPAYDSLVNESCLIADPAQRMAKLRQAEELLLSEMPIIPIYWQTQPYLLHPDVKHWRPSVLEHRCYKALDL